MSWFGGNKEKTENRYIKGPLEIERDALVIKLNKQIDIQAKTNEQVNLLRFKVEVLVEMLAMEEKKYETTAKRLEALKWAYELQTTKLNDASGKGALSNTADEMSSPLSDIHGAMARLSEEFSKNSSGIVIRFADDKGQLASSLSKSEFVHTLMTIASSQVSPADCEAIAWRFYDHASQLVSVSEFIDYFVSAPVTRQARGAASAVRNSVNVLEIVAERCNVDPELSVSVSNLNSSLGYSMSARGSTAASLGKSSRSMRGSEDTGAKSIPSPTLPTNKLELALLKLVAMWDVVEESLVQQHLYRNENKDGDEEDDSTNAAQPIISSDELKSIIEKVCSTDSPLIQSHNLHASSSTAAASKSTAALSVSEKVEPLMPADVNLIVERFEMAGSVKKSHFVSYFRDISVRLLTIKKQHKANPKAKPPKPIARVIGTGGKSTADADVDVAPEFSNAETLIAASASPFRASAEWQQLKAASFSRPLELEPFDRRYEDTVYGSLASEFAEAKALGKPLPVPEEGANDKLRRSMDLSHSLPSSRFSDKKDTAKLLDDLDSDSEEEPPPKKTGPSPAELKATAEAAERARQARLKEEEDRLRAEAAERARREAEEAERARQKASEKPPKPTPAPTPKPVRRKDYNRVLEHYSKNQTDFEADLAHNTHGSSKGGSMVVTPAAVLDFLMSEFPPEATANSENSEDGEIDYVLSELKIPSAGASMIETINGFRRLLANYTNPNAPKQVVAVVCPPVPAKSRSPSPAPAPAPVPSTPLPALTQAEKDADDLLDRQIKAKKDLLSSTSPVVMGYSDGAEFNKAIKELSTGMHPDPANKSPFLTSDEFTSFLIKRYPKATTNSLKMFVNADMGSLISADGKHMTLKDIKTFLDKEIAVTNKHVLELAALDKKKTKIQKEREEIAANGGKKPNKSLLASVGKFFGMAKKSHATPTSSSSVPAPAANSTDTDANEPFAHMSSS